MSDKVLYVHEDAKTLIITCMEELGWDSQRIAEACIHVMQLENDIVDMMKELGDEYDWANDEILDS